jgi:hypothetical protein
VLEEEEPASRLQHSSDAFQSIDYARYRTERERADDRVDGGILEGDALAW